MTRNLRMPLTLALAGLGAAFLAQPGRAHAEDRSIDGVGNNQANPQYGATNIQLLRDFASDYDDGLSSPAEAGRPNARTVSNTVFEQLTSDPDPSGVSGFLFQWGQFLDHDIDLTEGHSPTESFNIVVTNDPVFPDNTPISLSRSHYDEASSPRQQINAITSFVDASNVYGSDPVRANELRTQDGSGRLKTSTHDLLPFNINGLPNAGGPDPELYLAGDVRANEQVALTALHTLFVREHNRIVGELSRGNSGLTGDELYNAARAKVGAILQAITYNEFLPALLGANALTAYSGYDASVDPSISNEFSTAAYRFGHSAISPVLHRLKKNGTSIPEGPLSLRDAFFTKDELNPNVGKGIEPLLRGLALVPSESVDIFVVGDVRNFLFGDNPAQGGADLVALNIQRGRDHGLASYQDVRTGIGLGPASDFNDVSADPVVAARLASVYPSVDAIDLWVGGLAEARVPGSLVGPVFQNLLIDQFQRLRDGDRFWYQITYSGSELLELEDTTLLDVIARNTKIKSSELPSNVFFTP